MRKDKIMLIYRFDEDEDRTLSQIQLYTGSFLAHELRGLELPDRNNQPGVSRILAGHYIAIPIERPEGRGWALWLQNVPGRSEILVHVANFVRQILGCIIPGIKHKDIDKDGIIDVANSGEAMQIIKDWVGDSEQVEIIITEKMSGFNSKPEKTA